MPIDAHALCTVCIPTYNQAEHLRAAIESVAAQSLPTRLLVANDASQDHTVQVLEALQQRYSFRVEHRSHNLGISANLQWLFREAETPLVMRLDSDDMLHPAYLERLSALLKEYPEAGYAHCAIRDIDAQGLPVRERRLARSETFQDAMTALRRSVGGYQVVANILLFRREALASVHFGAGSEKVNFVEDYDLSVRLADAGWGNVYSSEILASYRIWEAVSRPAVGRKLTEIHGITHIFDEPLRSAFQRRGWSLATLHRRRRQLAVANAEILDRGVFCAGEREAMVAALLALSTAPLVRVVVAQGVFPRLLRRAVALGAMAKQRTKLLIKRLLFRSKTVSGEDRPPLLQSS